MQLALNRFAGARLTASNPSRRQQTPLLVVGYSGGGRVSKIDPSKQGLNSVQDEVVKLNLLGKSESMKKKEWKDASGRKGKALGVYRFANKYGVNVDGYSPIYTPDTWSESGNTYSFGTKGLLAWAALVTVLLGVGVNLIIASSAIN